MPDPVYLAATTGQPPLADQVNQFLVAHPTTYVYTGVEQNHLATAGTGTAASGGLWIAQQFTASSVFTTGRVVLTLAVTGSPGPLSVSICADNAGVPSSTVLAGPVAVPSQFVPGTANTVSVPLPGLTVAAGTSYWVVAQPAGDASDFYAWSRANGTSGAATSSDGVTWSAQAYNLLFQVWDDTAVLPLVHTWEDAGARWTAMAANSGNQPTSLQEFTAGQTAAGYASSSATVAYSGGVLTGVAAAGAPVWCAPHNGVLGDASGIAGAGQVNQFLGTHGIQAVYQGNSVLTPTGTGTIAWAYSLFDSDMDQPFTMSGTAIGRVAVPVLAGGTGADLLVSLWSDSAGYPGSMIAQTRVPTSWITQLGAVSAAAGPASASNLTLQYTGNPLAVAQFNSLHLGYVITTNWPYPYVTATAAPSATYYGGYMIQVGGVASSNTAISNVYTIPFSASGVLSEAIPQVPFPTTFDGSGKMCVALDSTSGSPVVVIAGGSTSFLGAADALVYTSSLNTSTGALSAWSSQTALPAALQNQGMCSYNGYVYAIGGLVSGATLQSVYVGLVNNGQITAWRSATPLPKPLQLPYVIATNGFLFVIGGADPSFAAMSTVFYASINADGSIGEWQTGPPLPTAAGNLNQTVFANSNVINVAAEGADVLYSLGVTASGPATTWLEGNFANWQFTGYVDEGNGTVGIFGLNSSSYNYAELTITPMISVPLPVSGLTNGATYHIMMQQQAGGLNNYLRVHADHDLFPGNPTAFSSPPGAYTWTRRTTGYGVPIQIFDQTAPTTSGQLPLHLWADNGARITTIVTSTTPDQRPLGIIESTVQSYALNANQGFETGTDPWFASGGTLAQSTAQVFEGAYAAQITPSGTDANVYLGSENLPCMPGQPVTVTGWIWCTNAVTGNVSMSVNWYTLTGSYISTSSNDVSVPATTWTQLTNPFTAPDDAYQFAIAPTVSGTPAATQVFYVDQVRAYYTYTGPQNSTVTQIEYGANWPTVPNPATGTVQLA